MSTDLVPFIFHTRSASIATRLMQKHEIHSYINFYNLVHSFGAVLIKVSMPYKVGFLELRSPIVSISV